jgi:hypothetical protein
MAITYGPNLGLIINASQGETWYTELKQLLRWIDFLLAPIYIGVNLSYSPPPSPVDGQVCLIGRNGPYPSSVSGAFIGHENAVARYNGPDGVWEYLPARDGMTIGNNIYSATWGWNNAYMPDQSMSG